MAFDAFQATFGDSVTSSWGDMAFGAYSLSWGDWDDTLGEVTCPTAGYYWIEFTAALTSSMTNDTFDTHIMVNGSQYGIETTSDSGSKLVAINGRTLAYLDVNDTVSVEMYTNGGTNVLLTSYSHLSIVMAAVPATGGSDFSGTDGPIATKGRLLGTG